MTKAAKLKKVKIALQKHKQELKKYQKLFLEDGIVDSKEQKKLDKFLKIITKCEAKLAKMESKLSKSKLTPPDAQNMTASTDTMPTPSDADEVEMAFCLGIQSWCNAMRNAISEFEKEIESGANSNESGAFVFGLVKSVISELTGKYSLLFDIGMEIFDKITADLQSKTDSENKVTIRELSHAWNEHISSLYTNVTKHKAMFRAFKKSRPNLSDDDLREEIIKWPMGGLKGLPTEKAVKKSIMTIWMKGLGDSDWTYGFNYDDSTTPELQAGYVILELYCYRKEKKTRTQRVQFIPKIEEAKIEDLKNQKALDAFKQIWKGKSIRDTPLNIELDITFQSPTAGGDYSIKYTRVNGNWTIADDSDLPIEPAMALRQARAVLEDNTYWKTITVDKLKLD